MKRFKALDRENLIKKIPVWGKKIPIYLEVFSSLEYYVLYVNLKNKIKTQKNYKMIILPCDLFPSSFLSYEIDITLFHSSVSCDP